jgi:hypothetical protein
MQKLFNLLTVVNFVAMGAAVGSGIYLYSQKDSLLESAMSAAVESAKQSAIEEIELPSVPVGTPPLGF